MPTPPTGDIGYAQKPRLVPKRQPVDRVDEELDVIETFEFGDAIREEWSELRDMVAQRAYSLRLKPAGGSLAII